MNRLLILESGASHDLFAIDVYYHQSCYIKFALAPTCTQESDQELEDRASDV